MMHSGNSVSQSNEALHSLGESLRSEFQSLLVDYTKGWLTENYLVNSDYQELLNLDISVGQFLEIEESFCNFEKWLTSGFIPEVSLETDGKVPVRELVEEELAENSGGFEYLRDDDVYPTQSHQLLKQVYDLGNTNILEGYCQGELLKRSQILDRESDGKINAVTPIVFPLQERSFTTNALTKESLTAKEATKLAEQQTSDLHELKQLEELSQFTASLDVSDADIPEESTMISFPTQQEKSSKSLSQELVGENNPLIQRSFISQKGRSLKTKAKGLKELAQFLTSSERSGEFDIPNTDILPRSNVDISKDSTEIESYCFAEEYDSQSWLNQADFSHDVEKLTKNLTPQFPSLSENGENSTFKEKGLERGFPDSVKSHLNQQVSNSDWNQIQTKTQGGLLEEEQSIDIEKSQRLFLDDEQLVSRERIKSDRQSNQQSSEKINFNDELNLRNFTQIQEEIDLDVVLEALTQEINREYRRFYGS